MLNLKGAYIVVGGSNPPAIHFLSSSANDLFRDRERVVGHTEACRVTFGSDAIQALSTYEAVMDAVMSDYVGEWERELKALCARVILNRWDDKPSSDGGSPDRIQKPKPRKPSPSNSINSVMVQS